MRIKHIKNSSAGAQPISLKSLRGLGHFPNKIARVYKHEHCLPGAFRSWQVIRSGYRCASFAFSRFSMVVNGPIAK